METKHPCKGDYLDKFVQPSILSFLCEGPAYGFYMLAELERRGLMNNVDITGFYRALKKLEDDGKLESCWKVEKGDKPKKMFSITDKGVRCLQNWQITLKNYTEYIAKISAAVDRALEL